MYATVLIGSKSGKRLLSISSDAVLQEGTKQIVYVEVAEGQFAKREVSVGAAQNGRVPVRSGLSVGDKVVSTGSVLLQQQQEKLESEQSKTK
jgi:Cu(I)/Ag(I) efflux system membrane fusion protein